LLLALLSCGAAPVRDGETTILGELRAKATIHLEDVLELLGRGRLSSIDDQQAIVAEIVEYEIFALEHHRRPSNHGACGMRQRRAD
jgi:hypothetical protein